MQLALFDIDGTLTRTVDRYDDCFTQALCETLGVDGIDEAWDTYPDTTDSGLAQHIFQQHLRRDANAGELERTEDRYMALLATVREPGLEIPGAARVLERLARHDDWAIAISTGNWAAAARWKMARAGLDLDGIPFATADDSCHRVEIIRQAITRACESAGVERFRRTVYLGDAVWDLRAARAAQLPFIAVGDLQGASHALPDYLDPGRFLDALAAARVPDDAS